MPMVNHSTTISVTSRHQAETRGLTLFELLIALAVVLAIGALALPFTFREYERRESVALRDRIAMQALMARAEARASGVPYAMVIDETGRKLEIREIDPRNPGSVFSSEDSGDALESPADEEELTPVESWQLVTLPEGMRFELEQPDLDEGDFLEDLIEPQEPMEEEVSLSSVQLAIFMPDGTLLGVRPVVLRGPTGQFRLEFDPWTGRVATRSVPLETEPGR